MNPPLTPSGLSGEACGAQVLLPVLNPGDGLACAGSGKIGEDSAQICNLVRAAERAGVHHLVNISVVGAARIPVVSGVDRAMFAYASQLAVERTVAESGLPWTNLRATQFYDGFILFMVQAMTKLPVVPVPAGFRFQPVDAGEVAAKLVQLTLGPPAGLASDIAGPKTYEAVDLLRGYLKAVGKRRLIVPGPVPGRGAARAGPFGQPPTWPPIPP